jgi:hypothetical protein
MKIKILILLLLLLECQFGISQSFSLFYYGVKLTADTVLVRTGTTDSLEFTTWLTIRNDAATEKHIQAKKTEVIMARRVRYAGRVIVIPPRYSRRIIRLYSRRERAKPVALHTSLPAEPLVQAS